MDALHHQVCPSRPDAQQRHKECSRRDRIVPPEAALFDARESVGSFADREIASDIQSGGPRLFRPPCAGRSSFRPRPLMNKHVRQMIDFATSPSAYKQIQHLCVRPPLFISAWADVQLMLTPTTLHVSCRSAVLAEAIVSSDQKYRRLYEDGHQHCKSDRPMVFRGQKSVGCHQEGT